MLSCRGDVTFRINTHLLRQEGEKGERSGLRDMLLGTYARRNGGSWSSEFPFLPALPCSAHAPIGLFLRLLSSFADSRCSDY